MNDVLQRLAQNTHGGLVAGVSIALAMTSMGCSRLKTELYAPIPTYRIDTLASEVAWESMDGEAIPSDKASSTRVQIAKTLDKLVKDRQDLAQAQPARFRAHIMQGTRNRYNMTFDFQVGEQFFATEVEAGSIKQGIHLAMYKGAHPEAKKVPELYAYPDAAARARYTKIRLGIAAILLGDVFMMPVIYASIFEDYWRSMHEYHCVKHPDPLRPDPDCPDYLPLAQELHNNGNAFLVTGAVLAGGGLALVVWGALSPSGTWDKPAAPKNATIRFRPTPSGFRIDF